MLTHSCGYELLMDAMFKLVRGVVGTKWPQQKNPKKNPKNPIELIFTCFVKWTAFSLHDLTAYCVDCLLME